MKLHNLIGLVLAAGLLASGCATDKAEKAEKKAAQQAKLEAKAKVSRADAEKIALGKTPGGTVKEGGLEEEGGKLVWSFDIATPNTRDITEVQVNAITGEVVSAAKETAAAEEKEQKKEGK